MQSNQGFACALLLVMVGCTEQPSTSAPSAEAGGSASAGSVSSTGTGGSVNGGATSRAGGTTGGVTSSGGTSGEVAGNAGLASGGSLAGTPITGGAGGEDAGPPVTFQNPLNTTQGSDPFMIYYEGQYYLVATTWGTTLTIKKGATVQELKDASPTVIWQDATAARCCNMWAPEIHLLNGPNGTRWYHYYTAGDGNDLGTQRSYVLESEGLDPIGPYHYQGQLLNYWAIDGSILQASGKLYFLFSTWENDTQNVYVIAMTNPWTVTGNRTQITNPAYDWEQQGSDSVNEGPAALYHGGRTFVTYSASQCADPGYKLGLLELTGSNPLSAGSWWKSATAVFQTANENYGPGHNGFFKSPDGTEDWLVYHATANPSGSCWTDRTTRIQRVEWTTDGMPNFGEPLPLATDIVVPAGE